MGKASRTKNQHKGPAEQRSILRRFAPTIGVVVAIVAIALFSMLGGSDAPADQDASSTSISLVTAVPGATLDAIGYPTSVTGRPIPLPAGEPMVVRDGKPVVTYIGAEFCPYCAAERWAMVVALSRFGTFSGLSSTVSGARPEPFPETATVTFHGSTFESDYVVFSAAEFATNIPDPAGGFTKLDELTAEQQRLLDTYDTQSYVGSDGGVPFVMIGNLFAWVGASFDVGLIHGLTFDEIASRLADPQDEVAQAVGGAANQIAAMICQLTGGQPGDVCDSPGVVAARAGLPA